MCSDQCESSMSQRCLPIAYRLALTVASLGQYLKSKQILLSFLDCKAEFDSVTSGGVN
jgi:hypothetical protein